jgi:hypothetical protein
MASQTHAPPVQRLPAGQAAAAPHRQCPPGPHESAAVGSHAMQVSPLTPQDAAALVPHRHVPDAVSHTLAERATQLVQATPPMPQVANAGAVHTPLAQHP